MSLEKIIAERVAHEVFKLGDGKTPCQRLQFMCGTYPGGELPNGGMNKACFERVVLGAVKKALSRLK